MLLMLLPLHIRAVVLLSRMLKTISTGEGKADEAWIPVGTDQPSSPIPPPTIQSAQKKRSIQRHPKRLSIHTNGTTDRENGFAPRGVPTFGKAYSHTLPKPLKVRLPDDGPMARIHDVCSRAVNSRLGHADNVKFMEHFRYILVASQLIHEQFGICNGKRMSSAPSLGGSGAQLEDFRATAISVTGALLTATTSFAAVWLIHWSKAQPALNKGKTLVVICGFLLLAILLYSYARRQWLHYLRQNAVLAASNLVTNLQAIDASTSAGLSLVQEVELVSRGFRLSTPLPPITRMDEKGPGRRCARLRRTLRNAFAENIPPFLQACETLRQYILQDDLEKYLEVYDIVYQDIQEAQLSFSTDEFEDNDSLKTLRILQARLGTLRQVLLCSLLSLEAEGGPADFARWRAAVDAMDSLARLTGEHAEKINQLLAAEETFNLPTPVTPHLRNKDPEREKFRGQMRKLGTLSTGIRGLQAKLQILREESTKVLEESNMDPDEGGISHLHDLAPGLMIQYDSIGADLRSLVQAWEAGKASLALGLDRRESRRISQASSGGLRSPVPSLGGLTAVDEVLGSPTDALRALNGEPPIAAHSSGGSASGASPSVGSMSDEEVFEAIAMPRQRQTLTREERMMRLKEESERMASFRERREQGLSMMRELESVIHSRTPALGGKRRRPATMFAGGERVSSI
ncbi:hypothetical protein EG328_003599 [Venturia inaequalis]|uniref:Vezatin n=1 Tax=Venturia inaequalis TaxID=5025 RepID=A0A8H3YWU0_VENIN|nr:hypothetical protein EG328_003599 [Venturia inaequalis]